MSADEQDLDIRLREIPNGGNGGLTLIGDVLAETPRVVQHVRIRSTDQSTHDLHVDQHVLVSILKLEICRVTEVSPVRSPLRSSSEKLYRNDNGSYIGDV